MNKYILRVPALIAALLCSTAEARRGEAPFSISEPTKSTTLIPSIQLASIDANALRMADDAKLQRTDIAHAKRLAIAEERVVALSPTSSGQWQQLPDGDRLWHMQVSVPGATDLHLGFEAGTLPKGASLWVIGTGDYYEGPYTDGDAMPLWIPMVPGDSAVIELRLPAASKITAGLIELTSVGGGFRDLFNAPTKVGQPGRSGACNVNVVCPLGQPYPDQQRALGYYEFRADDDGLTYICTATLLNDVPADRKNFVLTAAHCMSSQTETSSMRVYWNYQSTTCATNSGWSFAQNQTGASLRATRADADFTLVEMNQSPNPVWNLFHAGWEADNIAPASSIGLHHPSGDVAKVDNSPIGPRTIDNCIGTGGISQNTHWLTGPYDQGTTEGGSSGSGLWIPASDSGGHGRRLIGVLSGGTAACSGSAPDNGYDCYGKFAAAWDGPSASSRLRDWLDPAGTGTTTVAGVDHVASETTPTDPGIATRVAADGQAKPLRSQGRGLGSHRPPFVPAQRIN